MTFLDLFAGVGGFRLGMEMAGHDCLGHCEIDKFVNKSYIAMHEPKESEWFATDITRVRADELPNADCWCFGFPCQDISVAGKQGGFTSGKRSSLFFAVTKLIRELKEESRPSILFIENVKNLLSINRGFDFAKLLVELDEIGYDAEWQVINSSGYVPQNRERIFIVGHLRGRSASQVFPIEGADRKNNVSIIGHRKGYRRNLQTYSAEGIAESLDTCQGGGRVFHLAMPVFCDLTYGAGLHITKGARCLQARYNKGITNRSGEVSGIAIPVLTPERAEKRQNGRRFKENGEPMFTLTSQDRHGVVMEVNKVIGSVYANVSEAFRSPIMENLSKCLKANKHDTAVVLGVNVREATKKGYSIAEVGDSVNLSMPNSKTRRGRVGKGVANTLDTQCNQGAVVIVEDGEFYAIWSEKYGCYIAIRRLTTRECFRLQGFPDEYFERASSINSDSQLYKQAGNSVTVNVIFEIAKRLGVNH